MRKSRSYLDECYGTEAPGGSGSIQVHTDDEPEATGLLDQHGNKLFRTKETIKFGFTP